MQQAGSVEAKPMGELVKVGLANHTSTFLSKTQTWLSKISQIPRETGKSGGLGVVVRIRAGSSKEPDPL